VAREAGQAVVDAFEEQTGETLSVDLDEPDLVFRLIIRDDEAVFAVDLTGESLNDRGYQSRSTPPVLAATLVKHSGWSEDEAFIDPFCDEGVIPIEAARIAAGAPNTERPFAFLGMDQFDNTAYAAVANEVNDAVDTGMRPIFGSDANITDAEINAEEAGMDVILREQEPLEAKLDGRHVVFHSPYVQERAKRDLPVCVGNVSQFKVACNLRDN